VIEEGRAMADRRPSFFSNELIISEITLSEVICIVLFSRKIARILSEAERAIK
tara:strand:+ start:127 stop:285 length:159 start_codon:yes stop_codon:yes gene_type:complete